MECQPVRHSGPDCQAEKLGLTLDSNRGALQVVEQYHQAKLRWIRLETEEWILVIDSRNQEFSSVASTEFQRGGHDLAHCGD